MKYIFLKALFQILFAFCFLMTGGLVTAAPVLQEGDLVAVCGDSITEQRGYSLIMEQYMLMCGPIKNVSAVQLGWGGERAGGFFNRIESHVRPFKPSIVTMCYGMNDGSASAVTDEIRAKYREPLRNAVRKLKGDGVRVIVVGGPGVVDPATYHGKVSAETYNATLAELGKVAKEVADAEGVQYADVHTPMLEAMTKAKVARGPSYIIAPDGIHPSHNGHLAMAYAFLKALGFDGNIGSLTVDYVSEHAEGSADHVVRDYKKGVMDVESTRYPYCFSGRKDGIETLAMSEFLPFNAELNRYMLIVKNAPPKSRITWGTESREFTAAQLAAGINLAGEFPDNPFRGSFSAVTAAIAEQQKFETMTIKTGMGALTNFANIKKAQPHVEALLSMVIAEDSAMRMAARELVKPVVHRIQIVPIP